MWIGRSALIACLTAAATVVIAQETPLVRVNTRLVEVDVVVHSKGAAVTDLKQDDFTVLDNGKPQKIASFTVISSRAHAAESIPPPPGTVSNRLITEGAEPPGITVVLYDMLNTVPEDQGYGRRHWSNIWTHFKGATILHFTRWAKRCVRFRILRMIRIASAGQRGVPVPKRPLIRRPMIWQTTY